MAANVKPLERFYAVTLTSVYEIYFENDSPVVQKIALRRGYTSPFPVGSKLKQGDLVFITPTAIFTCKKNEENFDIVGTTALLVALFFEEGDALRCAELPDLAPHDRRYSESRQSVARAIFARKHPQLLTGELLAFPQDDTTLIN